MMPGRDPIIIGNRNAVLYSLPQYLSVFKLSFSAPSFATSRGNFFPASPLGALGSDYNVIDSFLFGIESNAAVLPFTKSLGIGVRRAAVTRTACLWLISLIGREGRITRRPTSTN